MRIERLNDAFQEWRGPEPGARSGSVPGRSKGSSAAVAACSESAKETLLRAGMFAFRDRRAKKRRIPQAVHHPARARPPRCAGSRYSRLIHGLQLAKIGLDRKSLSELAIHDPEAFDAIVAQVREQLDRHDAEVRARQKAKTA